jgi:hypothetical protein
MTAPLAIDLSGQPLLQYAARQDVVFQPHAKAGARGRLT